VQSAIRPSKPRNIKHWSLIQICITSSLESTSRFIPSASPVLSRFTSSSTSQLISLIIPALIIHHSFTLSLQAQNLPFQQILPTSDLFYLLNCLTIMGLDRTYHAHHFIFSFTFYFFCLFHVVDQAGYSSAFYCMLNTQYRIISYSQMRIKPCLATVCRSSTAARSTLVTGSER